MNWIALLTTFSLIALPAAAQPGAAPARIIHFKGVARIGDSVAYLERHEVQYDATGRLLETLTRYEDPAGKPIAELRADYRQSLTVPEHVCEDFRSGNIEGIRREAGKIVMFDKDRGKPERSRIVNEKDFSDGLLVACQGLNYYILGNLDRMDPKAELPIRYLIPGKLTTFDFELKETDASPDGVVDFEVTVQNWLLRFFAPKLYVKYDRNARRLLEYRGISNIPGDRGQTQNVTITYEYPS